MEYPGTRSDLTRDWPALTYERWHRYLYVSQFVEGKRVLDLASGEGFGSNLLAKTAQCVVGIDVDEAAIAHAAAAPAQRPASRSPST